MNSIELKQKYIEFFKSKNHAVIESTSLIPENDPTVLFTTAGMQPLVPFLMGHPHPLGTRLVDCQGCVRTTDIEEVGDATHFTFFEMLGNWSLGDYFKKEAIEYAYEFLTSPNWLNLDKNRLAVTCYSGNKDLPKDTEASEVWQSVGIPINRIAFIEDNWWGPAGTSGPCGSDTEIFYWKNNSEPVPEVFDPEDDNWVEIWNLVLMEYNKQKDGTFTKLEQKNIDTGMGLERVCMILNDCDDVYKIGKVNQILKYIETLSNQNVNDNNIKSYKIITDHLRASVFILGDSRGVVPSNMDQGYILRRFIRRAIRHSRQIEITENFCSKVGEFIIDLYKDEYNNLNTKKEFIISELNKEEIKFRNTLEKGLKEFNKIITNKNNISDNEAFLLFQSYGFPIEITCELASEKDITVDVDGYNQQFKKHQELSRVGAEKKFKGGLSEDSDVTKKLHTATHILNQALRNILSKDIKQKGSNINSERLRFDFNFDRKVTAEELKTIEDEVNSIISKDLAVTKEKMDLEQALSSGAQSEFGARYPPQVWVYSIGDYAKEICMGPHVEKTSELGHFKIKKEQSAAAGIRRIKAILE